MKAHRRRFVLAFTLSLFASYAKAQPPTTVVAVVDPPQLQALEAAGLDFGRLAANASGRTTRELSAVPALAPLFATLRADIRAAAKPFPLARVTSVYGYRLFDANWLASPEMRFELSGVFNRLDRRVFYPGTCGEVRFVYRLAYAAQQGGERFSSRLPMTVNLVFLIADRDDPTCRRTAAGWLAPAELHDAELSKWLVEQGPLRAAARGAWTLKSIETNLQTFRLQSSVLPSMAGHIEYGLRVFHPNAARNAFAPAAMENMPDVAKLAQNPALRRELLAHLKQPSVLASIDRGTLQLPERFLAKTATSFSPRGLSRRHNRPFQQLVRESDLTDLTLTDYRTIRSPAALLRRLDAASCTGCHQSRSIAGFHHIGQDATDTPTFNALLFGSSPHALADLDRRKAYVEALAAGHTPDELRPLPETQGVDHGQGAPCGLGDPGFASLTCDPEFACSKLEDPLLGTCLARTMIGQPCEFGQLVDGRRPHDDRARELASHACPAAQSCDTNLQGFPLGACSGTCSGHTPGGQCADFLDVDGFQKCLRGKRSFSECAADSVFPAALQRCDRTHACRQDYVCARTSTAGSGACLPPYFVFQLRLDGYPIKR